MMHKPVHLLSIRLLALAAVAATLWTYSASAATITENTAGPVTGTGYVGNSLTTPSGGPWDGISFNWFSDAPGVTPTAFGTMYLLTQEYLGTPDDLSPATPGFLATSQSISGGIYFFDPVLLLLPNTQYFFYANTSGLISGNSDVPGEEFYFTFSGSDPFTAGSASNSNDANYRLSGEVAVPEPGTCTLLALGCIGLGIRRRRVKRV